jgi:hypothetical protein
MVLNGTAALFACLAAMIVGAPCGAQEGENAGSGAEAVPLASAPPAPPADAINAVIREWRLGIEREAMPESYLRVGSRSDTWDEKAVKFLEASADAMAGSADQLDNWTLVKRGAWLEQHGCDDPMVLAMLGHFYINEAYSSPGADWLRRAVAGFKARPYPKYRVALAYLDLAAVEQELGHELEAATAHEVGATMMLELMSQPGLSRPWARHLYRRMENFVHNRWLRVRAEDFCARLDAQPGADPWLRDVLRGLLELRLAWKSRGNGWASAVTPEGWKGFEEHLALARERLERAYSADPSCPEAAALLITVAMGEAHAAPDEPRLWFDRAVKAQFDYTSAHDRLARALLPRWGGSHQELMAFGRECAATKRYDTLVPWYLYQSLLWVCADETDYASVWARPGVYPELAESLRGLVSGGTFAWREKEFRTVLTVVAWRAGAYDEAGAEYAKLRGSGDQGAFIELGTSYDEVGADVLAMTSVHGGRVREAMAAERAGDWAGALAIYGSLPPIAEKAQWRTRNALRDRERIAGAIVRVGAGEWVDLPTDNGLCGWRRLRGEWAADATDRMNGVPEHSGLKVVHAAPFGDRWEMECEIDLSKLNEKDRNGGILFGFDGQRRTPRWMSFLLWPTKGECRVAAGSVAVGPSSPLPNPAREVQRYRLRLEAWDGSVRAFVDDQEVFNGAYPIEDGWRPGPLIGIGGLYHWPQKGSMDAWNIRIRRLGTAPEGLKVVPRREEEPPPVDEDEAWQS